MSERQCACGVLERHRLLEQLEKAARRLVEGGFSGLHYPAIEAAISALDDFEHSQQRKRADCR